MEDNNINAGAATQQADLKPNYNEVFNTVQEVVVKTPEQTQVEDTVQESQNTQNQPEQTHDQKPEQKAEQKEEVKPTTTAATESPAAAEEFKFEVKDAPPSFPEGSFQAFAQELGFSIDKNDLKEFHTKLKENFVPKAEAEKLSKIGKEQLFSQLKPEVAAAFEMIELGVPQELAFNPTKGLDDLEALDDAALIRTILSNTPNWDSNMVDTEMEDYIAKGQIETKAKVIRANMTAQKQQILQEQSRLVQQLKQNQEQTALQQKEQRIAQFNEHLNKVSEFLGVPLPKETKEGIARKFNNGFYDNQLNDAAGHVDLILHKELAEQYVKHLQDKASAAAKKEVHQKLSNVPVKTNQGGARVVDAPTETNTNANSPFADVFGK